MDKYAKLCKFGNHFYSILALPIEILVYFATNVKFSSLRHSFQQTKMEEKSKIQTLITTHKSSERQIEMQTKLKLSF